MMRSWIVMVIAICAFAVPAHAKVPESNAQIFGQLPAVEAVAISPNGQRLAILQHMQGKTVLVIRELDALTAKPLLADVSGIKIRKMKWASDRHVLLWASKTIKHEKFVAHKIEYGAVFSFDAQEKKLVKLLFGAKDLAANSSLGRVAGRVPGEDIVLMPAYRKQGTIGRQYTLFRVHLDTGQGNVDTVGSGTATDEFFIDANGHVRARLDYDDDKQQFRVLAYRGSHWEEIHHSKEGKLSFGLEGVTSDGKSLALVQYGHKDTAGMYLMSLQDGQISGPVLSREDADVETVLSSFTSDQVIEGVGFASVRGTQYQFIAEPMQSTWQKIVAKLPGISVQPIDWSDDGRTWLLLVQDRSTAGKYLLYRSDTDSLTSIASSYPDIPVQKIGAQYVIQYKSSDGTRISGVLTTPPEFVKGKPLPMVVLPHGGPASHSELGWNWMAQYLANEGYLVLEPNYRGSDGFGVAFERGGDGKWANEVLDDINQGAYAMVSAGYADPARICIAGASFGGYEALTAVTIKPGPYKCAVSIAGVSDWEEFIQHTEEIYGYKNRVTNIWELRMRDPDGDMKLDDLSPIKHAQSAMAPVLMIHGRNDTVVPIAQSYRMKRALRGAGKPVQLDELNGEDHWLSQQETRVETLSAMGRFLRKYLQPENP